MEMTEQRKALADITNLGWQQPQWQAPLKAGLFTTAAPTTSFFKFDNVVAGVPDEEEEDDSYHEGCSISDEGEALEEEGEVAMAEEGDEEDKESASEDDEALREYCEPESNAVEELEAESREHFEVASFNKFKQQLDYEEQQQQFY